MRCRCRTRRWRARRRAWRTAAPARPFRPSSCNSRHASRIAEAPTADILGQHDAQAGRLWPTRPRARGRTTRCRTRPPSVAPARTCRSGSAWPDRRWRVCSSVSAKSTRLLVDQRGDGGMSRPNKRDEVALQFVGAAPEGQHVQTAQQRGQPALQHDIGRVGPYGGTRVDRPRAVGAGPPCRTRCRAPSRSTRPPGRADCPASAFQATCQLSRRSTSRLAWTHARFCCTHGWSTTRVPSASTVCCAQRRVSSRPRSMIPELHNVTRSWLSWLVIRPQPPFSSPTKLSYGTRTSS